jgi:hypothetical protein
MQGAYVSPQAFQSQPCSAKDLVTDAQAQAQSVAAAAGFAVGSIIAISDGTSSSTAIPSFAARLGDFLIGEWFNITAYSIPVQPGCHLEVKFKMLRYQ